MDIFLSPGDSPLTITPGDTTLHIRVSRGTATAIQNPPPALPVMATPTAEQGAAIKHQRLWRHRALIGLGVLAMLCAGLYSRMGATPEAPSAPPTPKMALRPPEFPPLDAVNRPLPPAHEDPLYQGGLRTQPNSLNQAFGLH
jgi:hypothetical protein